MSSPVVITVLFAISFQIEPCYDESRQSVIAISRLNITCGADIMQSIYSKILRTDTECIVRYGLSFVSTNPDLCSTSVTVMLYISCYIEPRCNDT